MPLRDQGSPQQREVGVQQREVGVQHSGNWQRKRPEEGGGWETLYDENGYPYFYSHYTQEQTYELPQGVVAPAGYDPSYFPTYAADDNYDRGGEYNSYEQQPWNGDGDYQQLQVANDWVEQYDEEGNIYYMNTVTGDTSWENPAEAYAQDELEQWDDGHHLAATSIQRIVRGTQGRQKANERKDYVTRMLSMQDDAIINKHTIESATKVQSAGRMHIHKHKFRQKKKSSIKIQTAIRGKLARRNATTLSKMAPVLARLHAAIIEHHFLYGTAITNEEDLFIKMDKDMDGRISKEDFRGGMHRLDIGMTDNQVEVLLWAMNSFVYSSFMSISFRDFSRGIKVGGLKYDQLEKAVANSKVKSKAKEKGNSVEDEGEEDEEEGEEVEEEEIDVEGEVDSDAHDSENDKSDTEKDEDDDMEEEEEEEEEDENDESEGDNVRTVKKKKPTSREKQQLKLKEDRQARVMAKKVGKSKKQKPEGFVDAPEVFKQKKSKSKGLSREKKPKGSPHARPPVPKVYHKEFEEQGELDTGRKRTGFLKVSKVKLEKRIEQDSNDGDAYRQLGFLLHEQESYKEAIDKLQHAIGLGYKNGRVWRTMGHCYFSLDQVDNAREAYGRALMHKSNNTAPLMFYRAARMEMRRREYEGAAKMLAEVESRFKSFKSRQFMYFSLGTTAYFAKEYNTAIKYFKDALKQKPKSRGRFKRTCYYLLARSFERLKKFQNRIKYDGKAGKEMPTNENGEEDSEGDSEASLSEDEDEPEGNNVLDPHGAMEQVGSGDFHVKVATFLMDEKFYGLAIEALEKALDLNRRKPQWLTLLAFALHEQGLVKKATTVGERAEKMAVKTGDEWRASSSPFKPSLKTQLPAWRLEAVPPSPEVVISSYSPRSRPSSAGSSRPSSAQVGSRRSYRPSTAESSTMEGHQTPRGSFRLSEEDISRLVSELSKSLIESSNLTTPINTPTKSPIKVAKLTVLREISTQMTPRESDVDMVENDDDQSSVSIENAAVEQDRGLQPMVDSWVGRSQTRIARVAALAARATKALASALSLGEDEGLSEEMLGALEEHTTANLPSKYPMQSPVHESTSNFQVSQTNVDRAGIDNPEETTQYAPVSPNTIGSMRAAIVTGPVTFDKPEGGTKKEVLKASNELTIARAVFDRVKPDENGTVDKHFFLDTLEIDFEMQEFIRSNRYSMVAALFLRKVHLKANKGASIFERNTRVTWGQVEDFLTNKVHTNAKGTQDDSGDSYDPRFAHDSEPLRSQKERLEIAAQEAAERKAIEDATRRKHDLEAKRKLQDWPDEYRDLDPAPGTENYEPVTASELDFKLSWQGPVHTKAEQPAPDPYEPWKDPGREIEFNEKRSELVADLAVARTNYNLRDLEAKQQIARIQDELRARNTKSQAHMILAEREGSAAAVAALAANTESVQREVERHITDIEEKLAMRRARKDVRNDSYARHVAIDVVSRSKGLSEPPPLKSANAKKIFVAGEDVEMRMLFADYEHGTNVRAKIEEVRTVHPHVTEEEAFLALAETAGNTDLAIGKLTDLRFYRDVNAVSNLRKEAEAGEVIRASMTALEKNTDPAQARQDLVYKKFQIFRQNQEEQENYGGPTERLQNGSTHKLRAANKQHAPRPQTADPTGGRLNHKIARAMASSPYLPRSISTGKRKQQDGKRKKTKKRGMADGLPGHLSAALRADNAWRAHGGERKRLNRVVGTAPSLRRPASGQGARAAKLLQHTKVSTHGAYGGVNPTIENPTEEYKAVIFAASELKPIPAKPFIYQSNYRVLKTDSGADFSKEVQAMSNLA